MGDNPNEVLGTEPEGTPEEVPTINEQVVPETQADVITRTDLNDFMGEIRQMLENQKNSLKQSMTDRDKLLREEIASRTEAYEKRAAAAGLSPATKAAGIERIKDEVARKHADLDAYPAQDEASTLPPDPQEVERALRSIRSYEARADIFLTPMDKEFAKVAQLGNNPTPADYERVYIQAVQAKAKRLGANVVPAPGASTAARSASALTGATAGVPKMEQLTRRLQEIQDVDPFFQNRELTKEREQIQKDMVALEKNS